MHALTFVPPDPRYFHRCILRRVGADLWACEMFSTDDLDHRTDVDNRYRTMRQVRVLASIARTCQDAERRSQEES